VIVFYRRTRSKAGSDTLTLRDDGVNTSLITPMGRWRLSAAVVGRWKKKISSHPNANLLCKSPLKSQTYAGAVSTKIRAIWDFLF